MASVIRTLVETSPGPTVAVASWWGKGRPPLRALARALVQVCRAPSGAVVHVHVSEGGSWLREGAFAVAARLAGKTVALTLHGAELGSWARGPVARTCVAVVLRAAHVVFALHDGDVRLARSLASTPVHLATNPVAAGAGPTSPAPDPHTVVFLGEQSRRKGLDVLATAWPAVRAAHPAARLVVAGPRTAEATATGPGVVDLDAVSPVEARRLLREAAILVLPSRAEALPMALLEAMAEGVPFVATDVAGIPRLAAAGAGVTVPPGDTAALTRALVDLLADADRRAALGAAGRAWWAENATPDAVHATLQAGYAAARSDSQGGHKG
jgi:glycosyltransferase involved in cell wall biosynthesis